jgi:signal transduction histidine kinase
MIPRLIILSFLMFILTYSITTAQSKEDSLRQTIALMENDTLKVKALNDLAFKYRNFAPEKTIALAEEALALSKKLNSSFNRPRSLSFIGVGYQRLGKLGKALEYYTIAKETAFQIGDNVELAYAYHNIGTVYNWQNDYKKAIELFYKSLKIFEEINDKRGIAYANNSLSLIASKQGNLDLALKHAKQTLEIREFLQDKRGIAVAYNRLGEVYTKKEDTENALIYFFKNIDYYNKINDLEGLAFTNINIAKVYMNAKDYQQVLIFSKKGVDYHSKIGNYGVVVEGLYQMTEASFYQKKYRNTKKYAQEIIPNAKKYNRAEILFKTYLLLAKVNKVEGNYQVALNYHEDYVRSKDSLFNAETYRKVGWEQGSFEIFKKEQENLLLKEKEAVNNVLIQKQQILQWSLITGLFLVSLFVIVLIRVNQQRNRDNKLLREQNEQIERQKIAITRQALELTKAQNQLKLYNEDLEKQVEKRTIELQTSNQNLEQANSELRTFNYIASHDIKEPIRNIGNYAGLIFRKLPNDLKVNLGDYFQTIKQSTSQLYTLIEDFAKYTSFSKNEVIEMQPVDLSILLSSVTSNLNETIQKYNGKVNYNDLPNIHSSLFLLYTIFKNLIENGLKYNQSPIPTVEISYHQTETHHQIIVSDNGIGISEEYHDKIFEMFKRLHHRGEYEGSGIGLAIVKLCTDKLEGTVEIESEEEKGSRFIISIPKI